MAVLTAFIILLTVSCCASAEWKAMPGTFYEYYISTASTVSWYGARSKCLKEGGDLVSIHYRNETDFINSIETWPRSRKLWIGLNRLNTQQFSWIDGSAYGSYKPWGAEDPNNRDKLCVYMKSKEWFPSNCGIQEPYVLCRRRTDNITVTPTPAPTPAPGYCPSGYINAGSKCYRLFSGDTAVTWNEAQAACRSQPGLKPDLASVHSHAENAFITAHIQAKSPPMWVGARKDSSYGRWFWSDNSDTDFLGNRRSHTGFGNCVSMIGSRPDIPGTWDWRDCSEKKGYVCQTHKDPKHVITTPSPTSSHPCTDGFRPFNIGCYRFTSESVSWRDAEAACSSKDSHLVAVHSEPENAAVLVMSGVVDSWLGMKKGASGEWEWSNGEYVLYTKWKDSKSPKQGDCAQQSAEGGTWIGAECNKKLPYVCKQNLGPALTTPAQIEGRCPAEGAWVPHGSYCYLFDVHHVKSWYEAIQKCLNHYDKSSLVSIQHVVDNDWIHKQVQRIQEGNLIKSNMFIGMHKSQKDGSFRWVDGSPVQFTHWAPGSPGGKACSVMSRDHQSMWIDFNCDSSAGYICKAPKIPIPTRPTDGPGHCPSDKWETYGSSCFLYRPDEFSKWYEAQDLCLSEGGYLSSILSEHENDFVHKRMISNTHLPTNRSYWVGASRINSTSSFGWLGRVAMTFKHWGKGFPNADKGDCVQVDPSTGVWKNEDCQARFGVLCRYDKEILATKIPPPPVSGLSGGAIAGIVIGVLIFICLMITLGVYIIGPQRRPLTTPRFNNPLSRTISMNSTTNCVDNPAGPTDVDNP